MRQTVPYAGGGKGRPRPLHHRPRALPLGTPIRCIRIAECQVHMPTGRHKPAAVDPALGITKACADTVLVRQASIAGGLGARCAPSGEREGQSPLAVPKDTNSAFAYSPCRI